MQSRQQTFLVYASGSEPETVGGGADGMLLIPDFADTLVLGRVMLVRSDRTADEIRDALGGSIRTAKILVIQAGNQAAWSGFNPIDADWLLNRL